MQILNFEAWSIQESKIAEAKGVSHAIFNTLKEFFKEHGNAGSFEQAKAYVASKAKGWELSMEDFQEAQKMMKESVNEADEEKKEEKPEDDEWKKDFDKFFKAEAGELENKATVFPEELETLAAKFKDEKKLEDVNSGDIVAYAKELLGMDEAALSEGRMKEIDMISKESTDVEDFKKKLKEYVKSIGKKDLADDKDFIDAMTADWKPVNNPVKK